MLDERTKRREDFRGGVAITLADGQEWTLARPRVLFVPSDNEDGFEEEWDLGDNYAAMIDRAQEAETGKEIIRAEFALATFLLRINYDLTTEDLRGLLKFGYGDAVPDDIRTMMGSIRDVIFGRNPSPKPSAVGSD